jgi:hypothetical protein
MDRPDYTLMEALLTKPMFYVPSPHCWSAEDRRLWRAYCWERAVEAEARRRGIWDADESE